MPSSADVPLLPVYNEKTNGAVDLLLITLPPLVSVPGYRVLRQEVSGGCGLGFLRDLFPEDGSVGGECCILIETKIQFGW